MHGIKTLLLVSNDQMSASLARIIGEYPQLTLIPKERDVEIAQLIRQNLPDLIFSDIEMVDHLSGSFLDTAFENKSVFFIFTSADHHHALKAFELGALDYLPQPLQEERVRLSIQRALKQIENSDWRKFARRLLAVLNHSRINDQEKVEFPRRITIKIGGRIEFVEIDAIHWIEAADQYVNLHTGTRVQLLRMRMADFEQRLNPANFFRIHRHAIVNLQFIREILQGRGSCCAVLKNGTQIRVSRSRKNEFLKALGNLAYAEHSFRSVG